MNSVNHNNVFVFVIVGLKMIVIEAAFVRSAIAASFKASPFLFRTLRSKVLTAMIVL